MIPFGTGLIILALLFPQINPREALVSALTVNYLFISVFFVSYWAIELFYNPSRDCPREELGKRHQIFALLALPPIVLYKIVAYLVVHSSVGG
jgi:hypothetical protein